MKMYLVAILCFLLLLQPACNSRRIKINPSGVYSCGSNKDLHFSKAWMSKDGKRIFLTYGGSGNKKYFQINNVIFGSYERLRNITTGKTYYGFSYFTPTIEHCLFNNCQRHCIDFTNNLNFFKSPTYEQKKGNTYVVINGKRYGGYEHMSGPYFNEDGSLFGYSYGEHNTRYFKINNVTYGPFVMLHDVVFGKNKNFAFLVYHSTSKGYYVNINGKFSGPYAYVNNLKFYNNGTRYFYTYVKTLGNHYENDNGRVKKISDRAANGMFKNSDWVYIIGTGSNASSVMLNGKRYEAYGSSISRMVLGKKSCAFSFSSGGRFRAVSIISKGKIKSYNYNHFLLKYLPKDKRGFDYLAGPWYDSHSNSFAFCYRYSGGYKILSNGRKQKYILITPIVNVKERVAYWSYNRFTKKYYMNTGQKTIGPLSSKHFKVFQKMYGDYKKVVFNKTCDRFYFIKSYRTLYTEKGIFGRYEEIKKPNFSNNGKRFAYIYKKNRKSNWIFNVDSRDYDTHISAKFSFQPPQIFFTPDSRHWIGLVKSHRGLVVYLDGKKYNTFKTVGFFKLFFRNKAPLLLLIGNYKVLLKKIKI